MSVRVKITVVETSDIVRGGLVALLKRSHSFHADIHEVSDAEQLRNAVSWQKPDVLIVNPALLGVFTPALVRKEAGDKDMKLVALLSGMCDGGLVKFYDEAISLSDSADQVSDKLLRLIREPEEFKRQETLSIREKEVVACVVQGMTNKHIADKLCLSPHTVITHRRNISSKLGIHSTAGLTIYAIVNKLVDLSDIKDTPQEGE